MCSKNYPKRRRIFRTLVPLVLASRSPRRRELLERLGIEFEVCPARAEEPPPAGEDPSTYALKLARAKAREIFSEKGPQKAVLAADTVVVCEGQILGKPGDWDEAFRMLKLLSGRWHQVFTAYVIRIKELERTRVAETRVLFKTLSEEEIFTYLRTDEPWDKAGAYAIQGIASYMVKRVEGSVTNVIGLPLAEIIEDLLELKIISWDKE